MAVTSTPIFPQTIKNTTVTIVNTDAQAFKVAYIGGSNGSKIESWIISSTDTSARDIQVAFTISGINYLISTVSIPINSGNTNAIIPINMLNQIQLPGLAKDANGNPYLYLANGTNLTISATTSVTAAKTITSIVQAGDY